jgi:CRISPR type IV-associated protein Csf3
MQPLVVTAKLLSGFASKDKWSPALEGILGYVHMRRKLGDEEFAIRANRNDLHEDITDLPIGIDRLGDHWWYQCSSPVFVSQGEVLRHLHRRFDAYHAENHWDIGTKSGKVLVAAGPYKNARLSIMQHITGQVAWHVIGDKDKIEDLLSEVTHVGARVGVGFGKVRQWIVTDDGSENLARYGRPLPVDHPKAHDLTGPRMEWGIRPPGRNPRNKTLCAMP